jgi:hypothetical protein
VPFPFSPICGSVFEQDGQPIARPKDLTKNHELRSPSSGCSGMGWKPVEHGVANISGVNKGVKSPNNTNLSHWPGIFEQDDRPQKERGQAVFSYNPVQRSLRPF